MTFTNRDIVDGLSVRRVLLRADPVYPHGRHRLARVGQPGISENPPAINNAELFFGYTNLNYILRSRA